MKRLSIVTLAMVAFAGVMAITVLAQNAHFMRCDSSVAGNGSLSVSFRIAGLGAGASDTITAHTTATSTWGFHFGTGTSVPLQKLRRRHIGQSDRLARGDFDATMQPTPAFA